MVGLPQLQAGRFLVEVAIHPALYGRVPQYRCLSYRTGNYLSGVVRTLSPLWLPPIEQTEELPSLRLEDVMPWDSAQLDRPKSPTRRPQRVYILAIWIVFGYGGGKCQHVKIRVSVP